MNAPRGVEQMTGAESAGELPQLWAGTWDPHDANRFITGGGNHIQVRAARAHRPLSHARSM